MRWHACSSTPHSRDGRNHSNRLIASELQGRSLTGIPVDTTHVVHLLPSQPNLFHNVFTSQLIGCLWVRYVVELVREKDRDLDHLRERIADLEHQGQTPIHQNINFLPPLSCTSQAAPDTT